MYFKNLYDSIHMKLLYFDDHFITGIFISHIGSIKSSLHNAFSMTDLGLLKQFLGLEIEKYDAWIKVIQPIYFLYMLLNLKMV